MSVASSVPDGCSSFPLPLIHPYFIVVQRCKRRKMCQFFSWNGDKGWYAPETNKLAVLLESDGQRSSFRLCLCQNGELGRVQLASSQLCLIQPFGQNGLQFAGVFKAQLKIFKAADGGLAELGAVHRSESLPYVSLSVACQQDRNTLNIMTLDASTSPP